eukprot:CAMPEP_0175126636 /NCGR_PEP_ID=MMETSP0087-20121206/3963_1 /TAXON_ID=136419 /ORGANISM="Unknown Unknown, Strain D1" /LENGTH=295 /DNA_ID=CAMNT_0016408569 /DNA_START=749 /DNA_END=1633 /DNA_ORIENTATION=-
MAPLGAAFSAGATLGPAVGGWLATSYGFATPFYFIGAVLCVSAASNYKMLTETRPAALRSSRVTTSPDLGTSHHTPSSSLFSPSVTASSSTPPAAPGPDPSLWSEFKSTLKQWGPLSRNRDMQAMLLLHFSYWVCAAGCTWTLMPLLAAERFGFTAAALGTCFAVMSATNVLASQPSAWLSDKFGRKTVIIPAMLMLATAAFSMPFAGSADQFRAMVFLWACGSTVLGTAPAAYVSDISTSHTRSQALALLRSASDLGCLVGAGLLGTVADLVSLQVAFSTGAGLLLIAGCNFAW